MNRSLLSLFFGVNISCWLASAVAASADSAIRVNFQAPGHPPALRTGILHLEDTGETFRDHGDYTYGWSNDKTGEGRRRNNIRDCRLDGHVRGNGSAWEIAVPNGNYLVNVALGDPNYDGDFSFGLEGLNFNDPDDTDYYHVVENIAVTVSDGKLTLQDTSGELKVCYLELVDASVGFPPKQIFPRKTPPNAPFRRPRARQDT